MNSFINQYEWEGTNFLTQSKYWKKIERKTTAVALNVLFAENNKEEMKQAYITRKQFKVQI